MVKWGIIGAGNIAHRFVKGLSYSHEGKLYAVASHTKVKQEEFKQMFNDIVVYDNYEDLLEDENIDAVYIATWHAAHYKWAKEALLKGKAVLCEKPAVLLSSQMKELADISKENQVFFMEAMKSRFIPATIELKKVINDGIIGDIIRIENRFCYDIGDHDPRYLYDLDQGGILNDVGSYNIANILDFIDSDVKDIQVDVKYDKGVDVHDKITIIFENEKEGYIEIAMDENKSPLMTIIGTQGKIECMPFYRPIEFTVYQDNKVISTVHKDYIHDDFYTEIEEVHNCINDHHYESQRMSLDDSLKCICLCEKIKRVMEDKHEVQ